MALIAVLNGDVALFATSLALLTWVYVAYTEYRIRCQLEQGETT